MDIYQAHSKVFLFECQTKTEYTPLSQSKLPVLGTSGNDSRNKHIRQ
uniref:Uncharacterized protein n=1 Tax=Anguilla anguilla TaxID=7936 RepID=A0A0E9TW27_ANGAN